MQTQWIPDVCHIPSEADPFKEVVFAREEKPNPNTHAFVDARMLRNYIEHRLRAGVAGSNDHRAPDLTEKLISFVGELLTGC